MTSLDKAKRFLGQKASRLALTIVPLAAVAVATPAKASVILNPSGCSAFADTGSATCTSVSEGTGGNPLLNWISMTGSGSAFSGGYMSFGMSGSSASGSLAGPTTIPVTWDFNVLSYAGSSGSVTYTIFFNLALFNGSYSYPSYSYSGSAAIGGSAMGSGAINISGGGTAQYYSINLEVDSESAYSVDIPGGSTVDYNPASSPEPSTFLLLTPAAGLLFLRRKKRV